MIPFKFSLEHPKKCRQQDLRAYSFGHLKSAKSSKGGRLRTEKCQLPKECEFCEWQTSQRKMPKDGNSEIMRVRMLLFSRAN